MTNGELHLILDDENRKLTKRELLNVLCELEHDCADVWQENEQKYHFAFEKDNVGEMAGYLARYKFACGESNAFHIALMLAEHLEDE